MRTNDFNRIAPYYDQIGRLIFGKSLLAAQTCLLSHIPAGSSILLAGGGTGKILEEIARLRPAGLEIFFVDKSANMLLKAKRRKFGNNRLHFIEQSIESFDSGLSVDVIFTPFLFDNFDKNKSAFVFSHLDCMLNKGGSWLYADFIDVKQGANWWQQKMLASMYLFFRATCNIEAREMTNPLPFFAKAGYQSIFEKNHFRGFIKSICFQK